MTSQANFIDNGYMFNDPFADTSQQTSAECNVSGAQGSLVVYQAPTGVDITVLYQSQDPDGSWHTFLSGGTTTAGNCDAIPIPFRPGKIRALITPSAGAGSAKLWTEAGA